MEITMVINCLYLLLSIPIVFIILHTIIRIVRTFYKFPMPQWMANLIDNPFRRKIQPPGETAIRHGIKSGMRVLEVGPGNGTYTLAAAQQAGPEGELVTIDIEPRMIERVRSKIESEGVSNIDARVANVYALPFEDSSFDLVYMIAVINEIPDIPKALSEFHRVLKPSGTLVFSEIILDPDYPLAATLTRKVQAANFQLKEKIGNFFYYTLIFDKG
jgi:ubiquinone/menaquinone biosynthesis C-methylase UbiE